MTTIRAGDGEMNVWDNERAIMGQFGHLVRENAAFDGCGTASLYHPNERKKQLFADQHPTFLDTHFSHTMNATASMPAAFQPEDGYYSYDPQYAHSQPIEEAPAMAMAAAVQSNKPRRKATKTRTRKATNTASMRARANQGGGGGPRSSTAPAPKLLRPKYSVYPRQEIKRGPRFATRQPDYRFDTRAMPTIKYGAQDRQDRGNNHNCGLPFISNHLNFRPTSEF